MSVSLSSKLVTLTLLGKKVFFANAVKDLEMRSSFWIMGLGG
jgi:hypothetical protein